MEKQIGLLFKFAEAKFSALTPFKHMFKIINKC